MTTLADELLNDFEDSGSEVEDGKEEDLGEGAQESGAKTRANGIEMELDEESDEEEDDNEKVLRSLEDAEDEEDAKAQVEKLQLGNVEDVRKVAPLMDKLNPILKEIENCPSVPDTKHIGSVEDNPEYRILTEANTLSTSIDNEIMLVNKFIRDHYSKRFSELETLISGPLDYAKAVAIIGNGPMNDVKELSAKTDNILGESLKRVLDGPTLMIVTVAATTSTGEALSPAELKTVLQACEMTLSLEKAKKTLTEFVTSRMSVFAPNLTALIGSLTAAQLLNFAGGLTGLAKMPACNLAPLGSKKQFQTGMATNIGVRQQGFLYQSPLIQDIPADLRKQAIRIVSAKVVLAARVDRVHSSPDGASGEKLKQDCLDRLDKLTEPPPNKGPKALPIPDDKPSRKRGGRRARKAKEATAMTDLRRAQNRMAFGKEEAEVGYGTGDGTKGLGMIGQANEGRIRSMQIDQRTKAKLSKNNKGWGTGTPMSGTASSLRGFGQGAGAGNATVLKAHGLRGSGVGGGGGSSATAGTASSIAFTPVQGLELVDPKMQQELKRKRAADEDRWFKGGTFTQVGGAASIGSMAPPPPKKKA